MENILILPTSVVLIVVIWAAVLVCVALGITASSWTRFLPAMIWARTRKWFWVNILQPAWEDLYGLVWDSWGVEQTPPIVPLDKEKFEKRIAELSDTIRKLEDSGNGRVSIEMGKPVQVALPNGIFGSLFVSDIEYYRSRDEYGDLDLSPPHTSIQLRGIVDVREYGGKL